MVKPLNRLDTSLIGTYILLQGSCENKFYKRWKVHLGAILELQ